ncbi:MAG: tetratricopeptide repeat protein [Fidelibacterota bacterium]
MKLNTIILLMALAACTHPPAPVSPGNQTTDQEAANSQALKYFMDGQLMMNQGNYAMAILEFQDAIAHDPNVATIYVSMAECYWNLGKYRHALNNLQKAISLDSTDIEARERLAHFFLLQKEIEKAEEQYRILSHLDPKNTDYIYGLADLAKVQEKYDEALELYEKVYAMDPSAVYALESAAKLALSWMNFDKANELYRELVSVEPDNKNYWQIYSNLTISKENYQEGLHALKELNRLQPDEVDILGRIGTIFYELKELDSALVYFEKIMSLDSANALTYHYISTIQRELGQKKQAEITARLMTEHFPTNPQGYINLALVYLEEERYQEIITVLGDAAEQFADEFGIQYILGSAYYQVKDYVNAEIFFKRAVTISPDEPTALHSLAIIYDNLKEFEESDKIYEDLIARDSTDAQAFNNYAYSLAERSERLDYALSLSQKANKLSPDNAAYLDTMGWIYYMLGNYTLAYDYIKQSVDLDPTNAVILEHLGDVYLKKNEPDKALETYQRALELDQDNQDILAKINAI